MVLAWWLLVVGFGLAAGAPDAMARPVRPKSFASPDDLRTYLDQLGQYYAVAGRPRFGKRVPTGLAIPLDSVISPRYNQEPSHLYDFLYQTQDD